MSDLSASFIQTSPTPDGRRLAISNAVLGMLIFVVCEIMFFGGLISAYLVGKAAALDKGGTWPPADQPRLPIWSTAFNTAVLLISGWFMSRTSITQHQPEGKDATQKLLAIAIGLGSFFVLFQGYEWMRLIDFGLTIQSSTYGSFFYIIVGAHALHVIMALGVLFYVHTLLKQGRLTDGALGAARIFWYFVVGLWPVLYVTVYLL